MAASTKQELLQRAATLVGRDELAIRLKIPPAVLEAWIKGDSTMPDRKLVALADILDKIANRK